MNEATITQANKLPICVGFIMDGNRRFAKERGESTLQGHQAGEQKFREVLEWSKEIGIQHVVLYAFSTENWMREKTEVAYLMELFKTLLESILHEIHDRKVRIKIIGRRTDFNSELQSLIEKLELVSAQYVEQTVWVALSYGGRAELVAACNHAISMGVPVNEVTLSQYLWTAGMPDPDVIIRTGGDMRLSNFLPWQSVYSELFFYRHLLAGIYERRIYAYCSPIWRQTKTPR